MRTCSASSGAAAHELRATATGRPAGHAGGDGAGGGPGGPRGGVPVSIDAAALGLTGRRDTVHQRGAETRLALGEPEPVMLGLDRMDYTKGIAERLGPTASYSGRPARPAHGAGPGRQAEPGAGRGQYRMLRDVVERAVRRINGEFAEVGSAAMHYLHQPFPRAEMAALYRVADVMLVTGCGTA